MTMSAFPRTVLDVAWRVLIIAVAYAVLDLALGLLTGTRPEPTAGYLGVVLVALVTGAAYALVLLPLARRLPYRFGIRFLALFLPLYWVGTLSNLLEAAVDTSLSKGELAGGAVIFAIPVGVTAVLMTWLLPARRPDRPPPGILANLRDRPLWSWVWRTFVAGVLFAGVLEVLGLAWGPLIAKYYNGGALATQAHTVVAPGYVVWPEEWLRGVLFVLVLLPVLAVFRGRSWRQLLRTGAYVALIDAVLESWLPMLSMTTFPLGFRIGEGLDLTSDAVVRGAFIALLLVLPAAEPRAPAVE